MPCLTCLWRGMCSERGRRCHSDPFCAGRLSSRPHAPSSDALAPRSILGTHSGRREQKLTSSQHHRRRHARVRPSVEGGEALSQSSAPEPCLDPSLERLCLASLAPSLADTPSWSILGQSWPTRAPTPAGIASILVGVLLLTSKVSPPSSGFGAVFPTPPLGRQRSSAADPSDEADDLASERGQEPQGLRCWVHRVLSAPRPGPQQSHRLDLGGRRLRAVGRWLRGTECCCRISGTPSDRPRSTPSVEPHGVGPLDTAKVQADSANGGCAPGADALAAAVATAGGSSQRPSFNYSSSPERPGEYKVASGPPAARHIHQSRHALSLLFARACLCVPGRGVQPQPRSGPKECLDLLGGQPQVEPRATPHRSQMKRTSTPIASRLGVNSRAHRPQIDPASAGAGADSSPQIDSTAGPSWPQKVRQQPQIDLGST